MRKQIYDEPTIYRDISSVGPTSPASRGRRHASLFTRPMSFATVYLWFGRIVASDIEDFFLNPAVSVLLLFASLPDYRQN
jgi:hypothetical protein